MHVIELLPAYALGCLDEEEAAEVSEHLAGCRACRAELHAYEAVAGRLALAAPDAVPADRVKRQLMQRIESAHPAPAAPPRRAWWDALAGLFGRAAPAWGLASLILIVALAAGNVWLWRQTRPRAQQVAEMLVVAMVPSEAAPGAHGTLVISSDGEYGSLVVENLPALDTAHQYQVWLTHGGERRSGGTFSVNDHGYGVIEILAPEPLMNYSTFGVTLEPAGGSPAPTGAELLEGSP
jgi:anti-sigma-K factor RskA